MNEETGPVTWSSKGPTCEPSSTSLVVSSDATIRPVIPMLHYDGLPRIDPAAARITTGLRQTRRCGLDSCLACCGGLSATTVPFWLFDTFFMLQGFCAARVCARHR